MGLVLAASRIFAPPSASSARTTARCLIFDEVMSGFRVARGGAQEREGVVPDLTTLGKVIGGGLPVGAFGGRADVMAHLSPEGPVYQAGTLSGNPLAMAAGLATLNVVASDATFYDRLDERTRLLTAALTEVMERTAYRIAAIAPVRCSRSSSHPIPWKISRERADRIGGSSRNTSPRCSSAASTSRRRRSKRTSSRRRTPRKDVERTLAAAEASLAQLMATA